MHASCESPWHPIAKRCVLDTCFLLTSPFRGMLLTPRGGPRCLAPTAHRVPVYPMVSITFLCRACTAQPIPPLDPYVRLSPHTAHESGILWEGSISPAPRCIPHGQLNAFAGYLCTISRPAPSGPLPCARFSRPRTTMPYLTACRASEFSLGSPLPTLHSPYHPWQALPCSTWRTQTRCCRWRVASCPIRSLRLPSTGTG